MPRITVRPSFETGAVRPPQDEGVELPAGPDDAPWTAADASDEKDKARASTTATGDYVQITGTTPITAFTLAQGRERTVVFAGILTVTNNASIITGTGLSILTVAGLTMKIRGEAAGVVRIMAIGPQSGIVRKSVPYSARFCSTLPTGGISDG